jgi:replicative DNA helicase
MRNKTQRKEIPHFELHGKVPPQAIEIEESVIGMIMINLGAFERVNSILTAEMFYKDVHQIIYRAFQELNATKTGIDTLTVVEKLRSMGELENVGGLMKVVGFTNKVLSDAHWEFHSKIILEKYIQREMINNAMRNQSQYFDDGINIIDNLGEEIKSAEKLLSLYSGKHARASTISELAENSVERYYNRENKTDKGILTDIHVIDKHLKIEGGDLVILAARPAMGKTAIILQFARNFAKQGMKGLFISLEMTAQKLTDRMIIAEAGIDGSRYRNGALNNIEKQELNKGKSKVANMRLTIDDYPAQSVYEIEAKALQHQPDFLIIDYLGLIRLQGKENRNIELGSVTRTLKGLAKKLNIPVFALHQLSRDVEKRGDKKPIMSDLRDSGEIEQDADVILFLYREKYYNLQCQRDEIDVIISKYREGESGKILSVAHDYQLANIFSTVTLEAICE